MTRTFLVACIFVAGCGGGPSTPDGGGGPRDAGLDASSPVDAGLDAHVAPPADAGLDAHSAIDAASDAASGDAAASDAATQPSDGGACGAMDAEEGEPCGPTERPGTRYRWNGSACEDVHWCRCVGADCDALFVAERTCEDAYAACVGAACATDADCASGSEWCESGSCVACDNSGLACRIACPEGWSIYTRNGCNPCACAPQNDCTSDGECHVGDKCYAGAFCWDWCPPGDASCCFGNLCSAPDCPAPPPVGCRERGCAIGERCDLDTGCESSSCFCGAGGAWVCTADCAGGVCVPDV